MFYNSNYFYNFYKRMINNYNVLNINKKLNFQKIKRA